MQNDLVFPHFQWSKQSVNPTPRIVSRDGLQNADEREKNMLFKCNVKAFTLAIKDQKIRNSNN